MSELVSSADVLHRSSTYFLCRVPACSIWLRHSAIFRQSRLTSAAISGVMSKQIFEFDENEHDPRAFHSSDETFLETLFYDYSFFPC